MNRHHHSTERSIQHRSNATHRLILVMAALPMLLASACGSSSNTASSVATPAATATPDASIVATQALIEDVAAAATELNKALENPDIASETWRANAVSALATLSTQVAETTAQLDSTEGATVEQQQLVVATTNYSQAAGVLALGLETLDLDKIDAAATLLGQATASLAAAQITLINN